MLCHEFKCIFVHVPKVAGQSVERYFLGLAGLDWQRRSALLLRSNNDPTLGPPRLAHLKAADYLEKGHVTQAQFDAYFKFAFVRNPWDRVVSFYKYSGMDARCDFRTYLFKHFPTRRHPDFWFVAPQYEYLHDHEGRLLVDMVGRFEKLKEDFVMVCRRLGIPDGKRLPHANRSVPQGGALPRDINQLRLTLRRLVFAPLIRRHNHSHYSAYYDEECTERVRSLYATDVAAFGYAWNGPAGPCGG